MLSTLKLSRPILGFWPFIGIVISIMAIFVIVIIFHLTKNHLSFFFLDSNSINLCDMGSRYLVFKFSPIQIIKISIFQHSKA